MSLSSALRNLRVTGLATLVTAAVLGAAPIFAAHETTSTFQGPKANTGTATFVHTGGQRMLEVSGDFVVPDTPDPHWRVVDAKGAVHLLDRFPLKGDKVRRSIVLPDYVKDVVKVQVWCAWAEVVLGEASFDHPVK
jgi:hypothetical protein